MKSFLLVAAILNLLAAGLIYVASAAWAGVAALTSMSEVAELDHAGAIDPAKLSQYNPARYPTTASASEAIRGDLPQVISGGTVYGTRKAGLLGILLALTNATVAVIGYFAVRRTERPGMRARDHG